MEPVIFGQECSTYPAAGVVSEREIFEPQNRAIYGVRSYGDGSEESVVTEPHVIETDSALRVFGPAQLDIDDSANLVSAIE